MDVIQQQGRRSIYRMGGGGGKSKEMSTFSRKGVI